MIISHRKMEEEFHERTWRRYQDERIEKMDGTVHKLMDNTRDHEDRLRMLEEINRRNVKPIDICVPEGGIERRKKLIANAMEAVRSAKEHDDVKTMITLLDLMRYIADIFGEDFHVEV